MPFVCDSGMRLINRKENISFSSREQLPVSRALNAYRPTLCCKFEIIVAYLFENVKRPLVSFFDTRVLPW